MAKITNFPWFRQEDFESIQRLVIDIPEFALTFEQWERISRQRLAECEARGDVAVKVAINPKEFAAWCRAGGVDYNFATFGAFTIAIGPETARAWWCVATGRQMPTIRAFCDGHHEV